MPDDSSTNKEKPLQNPSLAIHDDSLDHQINVKIEKNKFPIIHHGSIEQNNSKNDLNKRKTSVIPSEEEIKSNLQRFVEKDYEKASLEKIKSANQIVKKANSENNLNNALLDIKEYHKIMSDLLFS
ncbi:hypothetical protein [Borreliella burgdorferi]